MEGFARYTCAALIDYCLENNYGPVWSCRLENSISTICQKKLVIEGSPGSMTQEEIEQRLKDLEAIKIHPRETMENRTLLARGERLYEESLGAVRQHVSREMARFEAVLEGQNSRDVAKAREELVRELDRIEGKAW